MLLSFQNYAEAELPLQPGQRVLVAVSGGVDSVVLAHLATRAGWQVGLAHCNFLLRAEASDADAAFVEALARDLSLPFFCRRFETKLLAQQRRQSVQMVARDLRYEWLEETRQREGYDWIATAHHLNDSVETVLYNYTKGCGIRGLHGIPTRREAIIRPLLFTGKSQIERFAREERLPFREDASNETSRYQRNKIRREVIPVLEEVNPNFIPTAVANLQRIKQAEYLYDLALRQLREQAVTESGQQLIIRTSVLDAHPAAAQTMLYEWIAPFGFGAEQARQILESAARQVGGLFYAPRYQLLVDREMLLLEPRRMDVHRRVHYLSGVHEKVHLSDGILRAEQPERAPESFADHGYEAILDLAALQFPLRVRHWEAGDVFHPLGLGGRRQKLKDFFVRQKVPRNEKERIWIVETADNQICWVVGYRIDERFKITEQTRSCVRLLFTPSAD